MSRPLHPSGHNATSVPMIRSSGRRQACQSRFVGSCRTGGGKSQHATEGESSATISPSPLLYPLASSAPCPLYSAAAPFEDAPLGSVIAYHVMALSRQQPTHHVAQVLDRMDHLYDATFTAWIKSEDNVHISAVHLKRLSMEYSLSRVLHGITWLITDWSWTHTFTLLRIIWLDTLWRDGISDPTATSGTTTTTLSSYPSSGPMDARHPCIPRLILVSELLLYQLKRPSIHHPSVDIALLCNEMISYYLSVWNRDQVFFFLAVLLLVRVMQGQRPTLLDQPWNIGHVHLFIDHLNPILFSSLEKHKLWSFILPYFRSSHPITSPSSLHGPRAGTTRCSTTTSVHMNGLKRRKL